MANNYKIFDGVNWIDICDCKVTIKTPTEWRELDPWDCVTKYWDGSNWCEVICCECPEGYVYAPETRDCYRLDIIPAEPAGGATAPIVEGTDSIAYGDFGARLYEDISSKVYPLNGWQNNAICSVCASGYQVVDNAGTGSLLNVQQTSIPTSNIFNAQGTTTKGRLNLIGINATGWPINEWLTVEFCVEIVQEKTYIFAIAGDNQIRAGITSTTFNGGVTNLNLVNLWGSSNPTGLPKNSSKTNPFKMWHMFPITLPAGLHTFQLSGMDFSIPFAFGAEIYDISVADLIGLMTNAGATVADLQPHIIFSTIDLVTTPPLVVALPGETITWTCPPGYDLNGCFGVPSCVFEDNVPCGGTPPAECIIYSNFIVTFPVNRVDFYCNETPIGFYVSSVDLLNMTELVDDLNISQSWGDYSDNGDRRVRMVVSPAILADTGCPCEQFSMIVSYEAP